MTPWRVPSLRDFGTLLSTLWLVVVGGIRVFAWDSLHQGVIDLRPLSRTLRVVTVIGLALVLLFLASILFNTAIRQIGTLEPLPLESGTERGYFVPMPVIPLTLFAIALGWALALTGALHTRAAVKWLVLLLYLFFGASGMITGTFQALSLDQPVLLFLNACLLILTVGGLVLACWLLPRVQWPFVIEFGLILVFVGGFTLLNLYSNVQAQNLTGTNFVGGYMVSGMVRNAQIVTIPFLFIAGLEWANFAIAVSSWVSQAARRHATPWILTWMLILLLAYRLAYFVESTLLSGMALAQLLPHAGAALTLAGLIPIWLWRRRMPEDAGISGRLLVGLILGVILFQLLLQPVITLVSFAALFNPLRPGILADQNRALNWILELSGAYQEYFYLLVAGVGGVIAFIARRRRRYSLAAYGLILAWTQFWWWWMQEERPLEPLRYTYANVDTILLLALTVMTLCWLLRRALTVSRALTILGLAVLAWVLNNTEFLDNPFSPLFGFAGVLFLAFGILWNVLTIGGRFTNTDSPAFPRASRILLYLGYVLLTVAVVHWFIVIHDVAAQTFQNDLTFGGFRIFGLGLAYLVLVEGGRPLLSTSNP